MIGLSPRANLTLGMEEIVAFCSVLHPFRQTSKAVEKLTGVKISSKEAHLVIGKRGEEAKQERANELEAFYAGGWYQEQEEMSKEGPERLYVEVDGTMVNCQEEGKEEMEVKVGVVHRGVEHLGGGRYALKERVYVGTYKDAQRLGEEVYMEAFRQGVEWAGEVIVMGDGAPWVRTLWDDNFYGATFVLDWRHLRKRVWEAFIPVGEEIGEERKEELRIALRDTLWRGEVWEAIQAIKAVRDWVISSPEAKESLTGLMKYIEENREGIRYQELRERGIWVGTGHVEKAIDLTVCRRQKERGMSWKREKADNLLALRLLYLNERWDEFWQARSTKAA